MLDIRGDAMSDTINVFKNGKVEVKRGFVTATVDPREHGMKRWHILVRPPGRLKPIVGLVGYRSIFGPFADCGIEDHPRAITEKDGWLFEGIPNNATTEDKVRMAVKMLDGHFHNEELEGKR